jgi:ribosomal protein L14
MMAVVGSVVDVIDKSGALKVKCIRILAGKKFWSTGGRAMVVVKDARPVRRRKRSIREGELHMALMVQCTGSFSRSTGYSIKFFDTSIVLIKKSDSMPLSNRIVGSVSQSLRFVPNSRRILSMAYDAF